MISDPGGAARALRAARWCAWGVFLAWAAFWMWFNIASGIGELAEQGPMALLMHLIMPALILLVGYAAWRSHLAGGALLVVGVVLFASWFGWQGWMLAAILEAPPLLAGAAFLAAWGLGRGGGETGDGGAEIGPVAA